MLKASGQFFAAFFTIFSAIDKVARAVDNIAGIAEAESKGLAKQMEVEREARIAKFRDDVSQLKSA
jgi:ribosomal protein S13